MKKIGILLLIVVIAMSVFLFTACGGSGGQSGSNDSASQDVSGGESQDAGNGESVGGSSDLKVALVVNQRLGDGGVVDQMDSGLKKAGEEFGVEVKTLESESQANHEEDIRSMAEAGYDLIITSFPPMSEATKVVAQEFPDTKFGAVYQFINEGEDKLPNVNSVEFKGNGAMFVEGYVAGLLTETNKLGFIIGGEEPGTNGEANGWMLGIATSNPNAAVEYANANSFEDTAKGKELASAMASNDVDLVHVIGSKIGTGVIEGAADAGIMADSDVNDYYEQYNGMVGYVGMGFDTVTYDIVKDATENNFKGGTHGIADITNGGYFMGWDAYERYANENADVKDKVLNAIEKGKEIEAKIISGEQEIPFDPDAPDFERAKASVK